MSDVFDGKPTIGNSTRNGFFPCVEAHYIVRIELCKIKQTTDNSGPAFIAELEVLESNHAETEVGEFRDYYRGLDAATKIQRRMIQQDLGTFLCAAAGFDPDKAESRNAFDAAHPDLNSLLKSAGENNSLENAQLKLRTFPKAIRSKPGQFFTVHVWAPASWRRSPDGLYMLDPTQNAWVPV